MDYKMITVKDLVELISNNPQAFPNGLNTPIISGDFECNSTHEKHLVNVITNVKKHGSMLILNYEMHEDYEIPFE